MGTKKKQKKTKISKRWFKIFKEKGGLKPFGRRRKFDQNKGRVEK